MTTLSLPERLVDFTGWLPDMTDRQADQGTIYSAVDYLLEHDVTTLELLSLYAGDPPSWLLESFWQEYNLWTVFFEWHKRAWPLAHKEKMKVKLDSQIPELSLIMEHFGKNGMKVGEALRLAEESGEVLRVQSTDGQDHSSRPWQHRAHHCRRIMKHRVLQLFPEVKRTFTAWIWFSELSGAMLRNIKNVPHGGVITVFDLISGSNGMGISGLQHQLDRDGIDRRMLTRSLFDEKCCTVSQHRMCITISQTRAAPQWIDVKEQA